MRGAAAFLMTPGTPGNLMYPNEVELIRATVSDIIPDVTFQILPYEPVALGGVALNVESLLDTGAGCEILVHHDLKSFIKA